MAIINFTTVVIDFEGTTPQPDKRPGTFIRLAIPPKQHTFALYDGSRAVYQLTAAEMNQLLALLGQMQVTAPWKPTMGFDGRVCTLIIKDAQSEMNFSWWMSAPPEWERVGAVFAYVMGIAERYG